MPFSLLIPDTPGEAIQLLAEPGAPPTTVLAGGTDLLFDLSGPRPEHRRVVSLRRLPWRTVGWNGSTLSIGSTAPLSDLEGDPRVRRDLPGLWSAVRAVGGVPLRHRATMGGNLARAAPVSDLIPILLALDARVHLIGVGGPRTLSVSELIRGPRSTALGPAELIESVEVPEPRPSAYLWQRVRPANDISQVGVAAAWSPSLGRWRIAAGGLGPVPTRMVGAESLLDTHRPTSEIVARAAVVAAEQAEVSGDKRATEDYRRRVLEVLIVRAVKSSLPAGGEP
ncbi:MAG TPA: FAD binding domain-containing protein [Thermoplasmata archaeon]|nr:FAD binding domain-containing protein [Thermoplasmata archaeon]